VKTAAENALAQLNAPGVDDAIAAGICSGNVPERLAMINAAAARVNTSVVPALLTSARDADESVQAAAFKALGKLGNAKIYSQLVEMLPSVRNAALETAIITAGRRLNDPTAQLAPLLALLQQDSLSVEAQAAAMRTLAPIGGADALASVRTRLASSDAKLKDAAARALCEWSDVAALDDLKQLAADATASALHRTLAERAVTRLTTTKPPRGGGKVAARPSQSSAARRAALAKSLPKDTQLLVYLDCGPEKEAKAASGETLRVARGKPWQWADEPAATVAFDGQAVLVEATGLNVKKHYQLGFTWWDHDGNGRAQSVWIGEQQAVEKTSLPKQESASFTVPVPAAVIKNGKVAVEFRREAASNAVVSELWLVECSGNVPAAKSTDPSRLKTAPTTNAGVPATPVHVPAAPENVPVITTPVVKFNGGAAKKILVVTGLEYPGHKWRETAPVLAEAIGADKRLEVSVVEDPKFLASGTGILPVSSGRPSSRVPGLEAQATGLLKYDAIVLNYQNHNVAAPEGALANLKSAVEGGTGLVLFHFACGAFIDWKTKTVSKDFLAIAGRVWNPKLRGHDPYGAFKVSITDAQHPITKGLSDFETTDELYTCLDGDVPVQVLAKATSKVDKKEYPMVFVLTPGKGRAFHCVLGHDVKALNGPVQQLYRRGTAWAAGLEPSTQKGE
jgi:type 1 glutamine amidotransferase/HEAT repeat protein